MKDKISEELELDDVFDLLGVERTVNKSKVNKSKVNHEELFPTKETVEKYREILKTVRMKRFQLQQLEEGLEDLIKAAASLSKRQQTMLEIFAEGGSNISESTKEKPGKSLHRLIEQKEQRMNHLESILKESEDGSQLSSELLKRNGYKLTEIQDLSVCFPNRIHVEMKRGLGRPGKLIKLV